jgi:ubiquinone/menaquinone biosynthesis C-methylase UbiE
MAKTQKELAFLRDIYVAEGWTRRFTDLVDAHFEFQSDDNVLYINAGTGMHALALSERLDDRIDLFATCENEDILNIARDKATATRSKLEFSMKRFEDNSFDAVIADATFVRPKEYQSLLDESVRMAAPGANVCVFLVTSGSFGEIFSLLWEVLFTEELGEHGQVAEEMIMQFPTVSQIESAAERAGLIHVRTHTANEVFEYSNGTEFISSPLIEDFLLPPWLVSLNEDERERVAKKLSDLIDSEDGSLSFRFSVKAALVVGEKA